MALWRPFADDGPEDLSVPRVQEEELLQEYNPPHLPLRQEYYPPPQQQPVPPYFPPCGGYYGAPVMQVSPENSSGYNSPESAVEVPNIRNITVDDDDPEFRQYRENALNVMAKKNGGAFSTYNPRMRRSVCANPAAPADAAYRRQRERNNLAAKLSRDRRKLREMDLALKVSYLKNKVAVLQAALNNQVCLRCSRTWVTKSEP